MKKTIFFCTLILILLRSLSVQSQVFVGENGQILDNNCLIGADQFNIEVNGLAPNVSLKSVTISITHTYDGDLNIFLTAPDGASIDLSTNNGSFNDNYTSTIFDDSAAEFITNGVAPFTGTYKPEGTVQSVNCLPDPDNYGTYTLTSAFSNSPVNGVWKLEIYDDAQADIGTLDAVTLLFEEGTTNNAGFVGINTETPTSNLDVNGRIKVGDSDASAQEGEIRYNSESKTFEGYNGTQWLDLAMSGGNGGGPIGDPANLPNPTTLPDGVLYGYSIDVEGNTLAIGAPGNANTGSTGVTGRVYIYELGDEGWEEQDILTIQTANPSNTGANFGFDLDIDGNLMVISAIDAFDPNAGFSGLKTGAIYIYEKVGSTWNFRQEVYDPTVGQDVSPGHAFGEVVYIENTTIVVGNRNAGTSQGFQRGNVTIFDYDSQSDSWTFTQELQGVYPPNYGYAAAFGASILLEGNKLYVGASGDVVDFDNPSLESRAGKLYIYTKSGNTFSLTEQIAASDWNENMVYGYSLALKDNILAVSAIKAVVNGVETGAVYLYDVSGNASFIEKLTSNESGSEDNFGRSLRFMDAGELIISASAADLNSSVNVGQIHIFRNNNPWSEIEIFNGSESGEFFGVGLSSKNNVIFVGSPFYGSDVGRVTTWVLDF